MHMEVFFCVFWLNLAHILMCARDTQNLTHTYILRSVQPDTRDSIGWVKRIRASEARARTAWLALHFVSFVSGGLRVVSSVCEQRTGRRARRRRLSTTRTVGFRSTRRSRRKKELYKYILTYTSMYQSEWVVCEKHVNLYASLIGRRCWWREAAILSTCLFMGFGTVILVGYILQNALVNICVVRMW